MHVHTKNNISVHTSTPLVSTCFDPSRESKYNLYWRDCPLKCVHYQQVSSYVPGAHNEKSVELVELAFRTSYLRCEAFFPYKAVHVTPTIKTAVVAVITSCTAFYFCAFQIRKYRLNFLSGLVWNAVLLRLGSSTLLLVMGSCMYLSRTLPCHRHRHGNHCCAVSGSQCSMRHEMRSTPSLWQRVGPPHYE